MNTPAHLVVNSALVQWVGARFGVEGLARPALLGALIPDLPMFVFFLVEGVVRNEPGARLWGELYFEPHWQLFFDVFNSIPLAAVGLCGALAWRAPRAAAVFASVGLHALLDLPLHHDDGHRHFLPLSNWRFASPVSYWDPRHFGAVGAAFELVALGAGTLSLWPRCGPLVRVALVASLALGSLAWILFYGFGRGPGGPAGAG